ncbi:peptide-binding protein [Pseudazoarcus pumilus]|uniref:ABC transporter substrate-binding protein n=1 Tax=Pseudazoarcus pumilus TaxID=2067960 RepID=A0A2I6S7R0_9RHOO|nr:peptide-binding protein [Pseudazoarcus pumilus]AUN95309.1 ABC transporter substrate-binding protein [Pseudazoarcus pumilus]
MKNGSGGRRWLYWVAFAVLVVLVVLVMVQVDRQWQRMGEMSRVMQEQAEDIRRTRGLLRELEERLRTADFSTRASQAEAGDAPDEDAFARARRAAADPDYAQGDWLRMAFGTGLKTITPLVSSDAYAAEVQNYVLESLLARDPDTLEWQGLIARDWTVSDDGLTITFRLRRDVSFSDGVPLTAKDVAFTFEFIMNEAIAAPRARAYLSRIARVTATDERTVEFVFSGPYFNSLQLAGGMAILPEHFYRRFLDDPRTFNESRGLLLGSGPYRLADPETWTPDLGRVELVRNPRYWGPVDGSFDRIVWRVIENDSARLTTFRNQDIDLYGARPREYRQLLDDRQLRERTQHFEYMSPTAGYSYIAWNQARGGEPTRFADARVRRAMTHLTDVDRVIEEVMQGYAEPSVSPFSPRSKQHDPLLTPAPYDLERARALLAEAGWKDRDGDGVLENEAGAPFEFELTYFQDNEDTRRMVLFLRDIYARAGIVMKPRPTEWSVMLENIDRKDFDAITLGWTSGVEIDIYQMFHSSQIVDGGDNFVSYRNAELDRLIDAARSEVDEARRMALWQQAERVMVEDQPYTFLFRRQTLAFVDERIEGLENTALGLNLLAVPVEVWVPAAKQRQP